MSDFAISGPSCEALTEWNFDMQCADEISLQTQHTPFDDQKSLARRPLRERIIENISAPFSLAVVDNVVHVKSFSKSYREEKVNFWKGMRNVSILTAGAGGVAVLVAFLTQPLFSIIGLPIAILGTYRYAQAQSQLTQWSKNLPEAIANQRTEGFSQGIHHMFKQDDIEAKQYLTLFSKVMTQEELNGLYLSYLDKYQELMDTGETSGSKPERKLELLRDAASNSPLCKKLIEYAKLPSGTKELLMPYSQEHSRFTKAFHSVESIINEKKSEVEKKAKADIESIKQSKSQALTIAYTTYNLYKEREDKKLEEKLKELPSNNPNDNYTLSAKKAHKDALKEAKAIRDATITALSVPFDVQIAKIKQERDGYLKQLEQNRNTYLLPIFSQLSKLHQEAHLVVTGVKEPRDLKTNSYTPQLPTFAPQYQTPQAPSIEALLNSERDRYNSRTLDEMLSLYRREAALS